jgi:hypothetical protein
MLRIVTLVLSLSEEIRLTVVQYSLMLTGLSDLLQAPGASLPGASTPITDDAMFAPDDADADDPACSSDAAVAPDAAVVADSLADDPTIHAAEHDHPLFDQNFFQWNAEKLTSLLPPTLADKLLLL